ncbi:MAG: hypothetical protein KAT26_12440 [Marinosulfonomonas sp.]|nr:hypothetical protein [Marinosulfonomonas sp.]
MRNTTYIKTLLAALAIAMPLQAQSAPPQGCFTRDYSDAHLAANPDQVVEQISLKFSRQAEERIAEMRVLTANQGHVRQSGHGGQVFEQFLYCFDGMITDGIWACGVECDGGRMEIIRDDGKILEFRTKYLMVGETEECGGAIDLAETENVLVVYRLQRVADSQCSIK